MTRRRNPPPRRPTSGTGRPGGKDKDQNVDNDLRLARAVRKAESLQKQRLRRGDWDADYGDLDNDLSEADLGETLSDENEDVEDSEAEESG